MPEKRNPVKQIISAVHKDARAGTVDLAGHEGFVAEVRRRLAAAGLSERDMLDLRARRGPKKSDR